MKLSGMVWNYEEVAWNGQVAWTESKLKGFELECDLDKSELKLVAE